MPAAKTAGARAAKGGEPKGGKGKAAGGGKTAMALATAAAAAAVLSLAARSGDTVGGKAASRSKAAKHVTRRSRGFDWSFKSCGAYWSRGRPFDRRPKAEARAVAWASCRARDAQRGARDAGRPCLAEAVRSRRARKWSVGQAPLAMA